MSNQDCSQFAQVLVQAELLAYNELQPKWACDVYSVDMHDTGVRLLSIEMCFCKHGTVFQISQTSVTL